MAQLWEILLFGYIFQVFYNECVLLLEPEKLALTIGIQKGNYELFSLFVLNMFLDHGLL